jgi:hypothetical protein
MRRLLSVGSRPRRGGSSLPEAGEYPYALCVGTEAAHFLGGDGITGGTYELEALSAMDDFIVSVGSV